MARPDDHHAPDQDQDQSLVVIAFAVTADVVVTVFRFGVAALTGSSALLAQAFQSTAESVNQALLVRGYVGARRAANPKHPFGYARERYFWSFLVALFIFCVGAAAALYESYGKIRDPQPIDHVPWAYASIALSAALDGTSFLVARRQARRERSGSVIGYVRESRNPEVSVVLLQDSAAVIGLVIATAAITLARVTGEPVFDGIGSGLIGCLLAAVAFTLAKRMKSLLIGEAAPPEENEAIARLVAGHPRVHELISLRTLYHGPGELVVEAQASFDPEMRFAEIAEAIDQIEEVVRAELPSARLVAIEPAVRHPGDPDVPSWQKQGSPLSPIISET